MNLIKSRGLFLIKDKVMRGETWKELLIMVSCGLRYGFTESLIKKDFLDQEQKIIAKLLF